MRDQSSQKSHCFLLDHLGSSRLRVKRNLSQRLYGYAFQFEFRFLHTLNDSFQRICLYNLLSQFCIMLSNGTQSPYSCALHDRIKFISTGHQDLKRASLNDMERERLVVPGDVPEGVASGLFIVLTLLKQIFHQLG